MSILIKGMKMPQDCIDCQFEHYNRCQLEGGVGGRVEPIGRPSDCPLIHIPDHGNLIDRDELFNNSDSWLWWDEWGNTTMAKDALDNAPVVIPAERSDASLCDNCDRRNNNGCCVCKYIN